METNLYQANLSVPAGITDVVLDTDTYNEIDDQFALSYLLKSDKLHVKAILAAPFLNSRSHSPEDGMLKSYDEIMKVLALADRMDLSSVVYKGSRGYLKDETTPQPSPAAEKLVELAKQYRPDRPLYVVAIAAITNVASALLIDPSIAPNLVLVWLGGHSREYSDTKEFNMIQDIAAARVVMKSQAAFVQLPCMGVVSGFSTTKPELEYWLAGKSKLADYLAQNTIQAADSYAKGKPWSRAVWDVTAVAWLLNDKQRFMKSRIVPVRLPSYDGYYEEKELSKNQQYVYYIDRDALFEDLFKKLTENK